MFGVQIWYLSEKIGKVVLKSITFFEFFANYLLLFKVEFVLKSLQLPKLKNTSNLKGPGRDLEAKYCLRRQSWSRYFRQTVVILWNGTLWGKFNFYFSTIFCLCWQNVNFGSKTEHQAITLWSFESFFILPNLLTS